MKKSPPKKLSRGGKAGVHIDWAKWDKILGSVPDSAAAEVIGCARGVVYARRKKLGLPTPTNADMARALIRLLKPR
jgi:hypothetical protein